LQIKLAYTPKSTIRHEGGLASHNGAGTDKGNIFLDGVDRTGFLGRLGSCVTETRCTVYAWALMDNHVHVLVRSGERGISTLTRRLLTRQRGTNENTNGLLRYYFPKGTDFRTISEKEVALVVKNLNNRPRKCLNYLNTPRGVP
jgi:hypothetical protein